MKIRLPLMILALVGMALAGAFSSVFAQTPVECHLLSLTVTVDLATFPNLAGSGTATIDGVSEPVTATIDITDEQQVGQGVIFITFEATFTGASGEVFAEGTLALHKFGAEGLAGEGLSVLVGGTDLFADVLPKPKFPVQLEISGTSATITGMGAFCTA